MRGAEAAVGHATRPGGDGAAAGPGRVGAGEPRTLALRPSYALVKAVAIRGTASLGRTGIRASRGPIGAGTAAPGRVAGVRRGTEGAPVAGGRPNVVTGVAAAIVCFSGADVLLTPNTMARGGAAGRTGLRYEALITKVGSAAGNTGAAFARVKKMADAT